MDTKLTPEQEKSILMKYCLYLGYFGKDAKEYQDFVVEYSDNQELWPQMVAVDLEYELLLDNYPKK